MTLGQQIIRDACMKFVVDRDDLLCGGKRGPDVTAARGEVIRNMKEHFSLHQIARMLKVSKSTISYHCYQNQRENVKRNAQRWYEAQRTAS